MMTEEITEEKRLQVMLQTYIKKYRELSRIENSAKNLSTKQVLFTEERSVCHNDGNTKRLVLFLKGTGCTYAIQTGGCTFCGFYNATNFGEKILDEDYISQVQSALEQNEKLDTYSAICIYNDGSMLREEEISFDVLLKIVKIVDKLKHVKKIVLESKIEDINETKLKQLKDATSKKIEIAVGFESANPTIRNLCVNKSFETKVFEDKVKIVKKLGISLIPLLMLKPPFLTEEEAITDFVNSLVYLEKFNLERIDMELPTIELYTLMNELWTRGLYAPAKLWSAIKIIEERKKLALATPLYISPTNYSVPAEAKASNCENCNDMIYKAFEEFNKTGKESLFHNITCSCKEEWINMISEEKGAPQLYQRISDMLEILI